LGGDVEGGGPGQVTQALGAGLPRVDDGGVRDHVVQRPAFPAEQDAREAEPAQQEAKREREGADDRVRDVQVGAVPPDDPGAEQRHAEGLACRRPGVRVIEELPRGESDPHPDVAPVPVDRVPGHQAGGERRRGQGEHEDAGAHDKVHYVAGEPGDEPAVVAPQPPLVA
jgi:hypothetical protein